MQQVGRFQIVRELGRGGMGIVYEAVDTVIGRTVALKTIRIESSSDSDFLLDRLFREARSAGALAHPGVVIIFDVGRDRDVAYVAMERVQGPTLEMVLARSPTPPHSTVLNILRQIAEALDHAHESGIVHRDIKPANIMLHKGKVVKITDFGVAKIQITEHHTTTDMILGTPAYMSPEQITAKPVDGRADQFSLAVVAFRMLTGVKPFRGDDLAALVYQIVHEERPSACALKLVLPKGVDQVLGTALAKDFRDRYRCCCDFVAALEAAITGQPPLPPTVTLRGSPKQGPTIVKQSPVAAARRSGWKTRLVFLAAVLLPVLVACVAYAAFNWDSIWRPLPKPESTDSQHTQPPTNVPAATAEKPSPVKVEKLAKVEKPAPMEPSVVKPSDVKTNARDRLSYAWIPPGSFTMGCSPEDGECPDEEKPAHMVTITQGFWMGQTEVTQEAYQRVMGANPSKFRGERLPVERVQWNEARKYCEAVGMRLPTEAEWEYAARGGDASAGHESLDAVAWYKDNSGGTTHEVGQKEKNGYGLYDMLGNVWEWTEDWYDARYYDMGPRPGTWIDPKGPPTGQLRSQRGGSWYFGPLHTRVSSRGRGVPESRYNYGIGMRCVGEKVAAGPETTSQRRRLPDGRGSAGGG